MDSPIYLDYHATTPVDPRVLDVMLPYFGRIFGNAHSKTHCYGWAAEEAVDQARGQVADAVGAAPDEVVFTSGATEANNLALRGVLEANRERGDHLVTVVTEHSAVLDTATALERDGFRVTRLPVGEDGLLSLEQLQRALTPRTVLVSVMHANNEIGVLQPLREIGAMCRDRGVLLHSDAAQSVGKVAVDVEALGVDLLSLSGHKVYGPKGVGALVVRGRIRHRIRAIQHGGGHENGLRSGTVPVPLVVGFGEALRLADLELAAEGPRLRGLRDRLWAGIEGRLEEVFLNGHEDLRLPNNLNVSIGYVEPDALLMAMSELAVSSGSACTSDSDEPSYVLRALGRSRALAASAIRFGLGRFTTEADIDRALEIFVQAVSRLREISPLWSDRRSR